MVRQRQEQRLTERMATAGLVATIPIRPAIEARRRLTATRKLTSSMNRAHERRKAAAGASSLTFDQIRTEDIRLSPGNGANRQLSTSADG
ncbi:hypothetical protein AC630_31980 [Bradyrhizobium sp. AS23.2]|nr:hypothetical protein AC630_31980 [Bradyrhizobium sp. AS23.2]